MTEDPRSRVRDLITSAWTTQVIHHSVKLDLFDALASGPRSSTDLARSANADVNGIFRLLRALATLGLVNQDADDSFSITEAGRLLCRESQGSLRGVALHWGDRLWKSFEALGQAVVSGQPSVTSGADDFIEMQSDPVRSAIFNRAMAEQSLGVGHEVARAYDFSRFDSVMDVGGGYGAVLRAILERYPALHGSVMDLPMLATQATAYLAAAGVADRAKYVGGNFFEAVPEGAGAYVLKYIIHDWNDETCVNILKNIACSMTAESRLLIAECVLPDRGVNVEAAWLDLIMLTFGGRERTEEQWRQIVEAAGLRLERTYRMPGRADGVVEAYLK